MRRARASRKLPPQADVAHVGPVTKAFISVAVAVSSDAALDSSRAEEDAPA